MRHSPGAERLRTFAENLNCSPMQKRMLLIAEQITGRAHPALPVPKSQPKPPKPKRKSGGGRKRSINDDQMDKGINIICSNSKLKGKTALKKLRAAGIEAGNTTLYKIIRAARKFQK